jgi:hypothetical protein
MVGGRGVISLFCWALLIEVVPTTGLYYQNVSLRVREFSADTHSERLSVSPQSCSDSRAAVRWVGRRANASDGLCDTGSFSDVRIVSGSMLFLSS